MFKTAGVFNTNFFRQPLESIILDICQRGPLYYELRGWIKSMTDKQLVIDVVSRLPDATTIETIQAEVEILAAIRRGEESADAGRVTAHEEVKTLVASWTSK